MQQSAENRGKFEKGSDGRSVCYFCNCHIEPGEEIADGKYFLLSP